MYSAPLHRTPFSPDPELLHHAKEREEFAKRYRESRGETAVWEEKEERKGAWREPGSLAELLEMVSPEDSALISLIVFLLCDNTNNDVVLLGILLYVLLSK